MANCFVPDGTEACVGRSWLWLVEFVFLLINDCLLVVWLAVWLLCGCGRRYFQRLKRSGLEAASSSNKSGSSSSSEDLNHLAVSLCNAGIILEQNGKELSQQLNAYVTCCCVRTWKMSVAWQCGGAMWRGNVAGQCGGFVAVLVSCIAECEIYLVQWMDGRCSHHCVVFREPCWLVIFTRLHFPGVALSWLPQTSLRACGLGTALGLAPTSPSAATSSATTWRVFSNCFKTPTHKRQAAAVVRRRRPGGKPAVVLVAAATVTTLTTWHRWWTRLSCGAAAQKAVPHFGEQPHLRRRVTGWLLLPAGLRMVVVVMMTQQRQRVLGARRRRARRRPAPKRRRPRVALAKESTTSTTSMTPWEL